MKFGSQLLKKTVAANFLSVCTLKVKPLIVKYPLPTTVYLKEENKMIDELMNIVKAQQSNARRGMAR